MHYPGRAGRLGYSEASAGRQQFYQEAGGGAASFVNNCAWLPIVPHFSYFTHMLSLKHMHTHCSSSSSSSRSWGNKPCSRSADLPHSKSVTTTAPEQRCSCYALATNMRCPRTFPTPE